MPQKDHMLRSWTCQHASIPRSGSYLYRGGEAFWHHSSDENALLAQSCRCCSQGPHQKSCNRGGGYVTLLLATVRVSSPYACVRAHTHTHKHILCPVPTLPHLSHSLSPSLSFLFSSLYLSIFLFFVSLSLSLPTCLPAFLAVVVIRGAHV